jgi:hypothetical protein
MILTNLQAILSIMLGNLGCAALTQNLTGLITQRCNILQDAVKLIVSSLAIGYDYALLLATIFCSFVQLALTK